MLKEKRLETDEAELVHIEEEILDSNNIINDIQNSFPGNWSNENNNIINPINLLIIFVNIIK